MTILEMPLAAFLGIEESPREDRLLQVSYSDTHRNHLETFHASVLYALAEISTGIFLEKNFPREVITTIPVLRKANVKYAAPTKGQLSSETVLIKESKEVLLEKLYTTGKISLTMQSDIFNETDNLVFRGQYEWFITLKPEYLKVSKTEASI